jgi:chromosome segregation ATPase
LTAEAKDSKDLTKKWEKPAKSSKKVKDWQSKVKKAHKGVYSLSSAAGSSGKTSTRSPLVIPPENPEATKAKLKGRRDINRATLENARNKLEQARAGYASSQAAFQKSTTELNAISQQLGDLRSDLAKLADEQVTLATVRDVLESCIGFLITLKDKVTELTMFFSSINVLIKVAVDTSVNKFEQYVAQGIKELGNGKPIADRIHQVS